MTKCLDVFEIDFINVHEDNLFLLTDILKNEGIAIIKEANDSILCQHKDYDTLLFAIYLYLETLDNRASLEKLL